MRQLIRSHLTSSILFAYVSGWTCRSERVKTPPSYGFLHKRVLKNLLWKKHFCLSNIFHFCQDYCKPDTYWKGFYSKRKGFASRFFPYRIDPFSKGNRISFTSYPLKVQFSFNRHCWTAINGLQAIFFFFTWHTSTMKSSYNNHTWDGTILTVLYRCRQVIHNSKPAL